MSFCNISLNSNSRIATWIDFALFIVFRVQNAFSCIFLTDIWIWTIVRMVTVLWNTNLLIFIHIHLWITKTFEICDKNVDLLHCMCANLFKLLCKNSPVFLKIHWKRIQRYLLKICNHDYLCNSQFRTSVSFSFCQEDCSLRS